MRDHAEMHSLLDQEVIPMYNVMDQMMGGVGLGVGSTSSKGKSIRNLIGQAKMREVETIALAELIKMNNLLSAQGKRWQYVFLLDGKNPPAGYEAAAHQLKKNPKLTETHALNVDLNLQLIEMEKLRQTKGVGDEDTFTNHDDEDPF
jgi:hypothetical protein